MEAFGARPVESTEACLDEVADCELFVGIYAHRYGYIPDGKDISITEQEFNHAKKLGKPIFGFVINEEHPWSPKHIEHDKKDKLNTFLSKVKKQPVEFFTAPDNLANNIASSVGHHLSKLNSANTNHQSEIVNRKSPTGSTLPTQPYFFGRAEELKIIAAASPTNPAPGAHSLTDLAASAKPRSPSKPRTTRQRNSSSARSSSPPKCAN